MRINDAGLKFAGKATETAYRARSSRIIEDPSIECDHPADVFSICKTPSRFHRPERASTRIRQLCGEHRRQSRAPHANKGCPQKVDFRRIACQAFNLKSHQTQGTQAPFVSQKPLCTHGGSILLAEDGPCFSIVGRCRPLSFPYLLHAVP
jgi:hypothetical protein